MSFERWRWTSAPSLLGWAKTRQGRANDEHSGGLNALTIARTQQAIGLFYRVMSDYRAEAAAALDYQRWLGLTHASLYRGDEWGSGRAIRQADDRNYINDTDLTRMLAHVELLGLSRDRTTTLTRDGHSVELAGLGQPAVMRAWLIQALTGRRAAEVLMMDFEPLTEIPGLDVTAVPDGGMVAKLRYQQTKVNGAPDTILVGADVVQIVGEQQEWVRQQWRVGPDTPRYLFPKTTGNRHATRPWETSNYNRVLREFSLALGLHDANGQLLMYSRSHRLRHTKATALLNAGAPIHVVLMTLGEVPQSCSANFPT
jgi:integrase